MALAKPEAHLIAMSLGTLVATSGITLLFPYVVGQVVDIIQSTDGASSTLTPTTAAAGLFGLTLVAGIAVTARSQLLAIAGNRIVHRVRQQLFGAIISQELVFFDNVKTGDLVTRLSADVQLIQKAATSHVVTTARAMVMSMGATAMMMYTSPMLCAISLCTLPPVFVGARIFGRTLREKQKRVQELLGDSTEVAEEAFGSIRTVRQFAAERYENERYTARIDDVRDEAYCERRASSI